MASIILAKILEILFRVLESQAKKRKRNQRKRKSNLNVVSKQVF